MEFLWKTPWATLEIKRKLAAILSADVKGYCRLMGEDEKVDGPYPEYIQGYDTLIIRYLEK